MFWGDFFEKVFLPSVPCRAFQIFWTWTYEFRISKFKKMSSVFRTYKHEFSFPTQYPTVIFFALTPQSKYAFPFQIFWTQNYEFRFPNLKIWVLFSGLKYRGRYSEKIQEKNQEDFKVLKLSKIVLKCPNMFCGQFLKKKFAQCSMEGRVFENFQKSQKIFKFPKMPKIDPKNVQTWFEHALGQFSEFFCPVFHAGLFGFSGLKNMSSVSRKNTQQTFCLHSRHSHYTQSLSRFSGLKIMSSDSRT